MVQNKKKSSSLSFSKFNKTGLLVFMVLFGGVGAAAVLKSSAATPTTETVDFQGAANIDTTQSFNYTTTNDNVGQTYEPVLLLSGQSQIVWGGRGGGTTPEPKDKQFCYIMRVNPGTTATVQLRGFNGRAIRTIKGWPYDYGPQPYQTECVKDGDRVQMNLPDVLLRSGGPVYLYGREYVATYKY
jgi:hypothetical protein